jgi:pimeloyl-ACP methyl ester carboxylesterase
VSIWTDFMGAEVKFYQAGPWRTRSIEAGSGTPLILIHGGGGHAETYAKNVIPLSKYFHVYAIDALAHGLTTAPMDVDVTSQVSAEHVRLFMDAAGIDRAHVAGESMGGATLGWLTKLYPERVIKYVSICGAGLLPPEGKSAQEAAELADQAEKTRQALDNPTAEGLRPRLEWLFHDPSQVTEEICETRAQIWGAPEYQAYQRKPRAAGGGIASLWNELPEMGKRTPILFLWTENNPGTHLSTAQRAQAMTPNSKIEVMRDCGHWPQWENAEEFNRILVDFLLAESR